MNPTSLRGMLEATRLTREGRLSEATALLQNLLSDRAEPGDVEERGAEQPGRPGPVTIDGVAQVIDIADFRPPPGPAAAASDAGGAPPQAADDGVAPPPLSALRGLFRRGNRVGAAPVPDVAQPPAGAQFLAASFSNSAGTHSYKLYVPSGYRGQPVPLVVMLHGCTQSPDDFAAGTGMNAAAEAHDCLVLYPAQSSAANMSKCWNWFRAGDQQRDRGEPLLIAGITRDIMRRYAVDPRRVYVAGLSAGAAAAAIMGDAYPDLYAAIGVHSGLACGAARDLPSALAAMRQGGTERGRRTDAGRDGRRVVPAIVFHGDRDTTVHPSNGDAVIAQSTCALSLDTAVEDGQVAGGHAYRRTRHVDARGDIVLEQWLVRGAGHAWSGGSPAGSYTDPRGPDATGEMLRFFLEHPRPSEA